MKDLEIKRGREQNDNQEIPSLPTLRHRDARDFAYVAHPLRSIVV